MRLPIAFVCKKEPELDFYLIIEFKNIIVSSLNT